MTTATDAPDPVASALSGVAALLSGHGAGVVVGDPLGADPGAPWVGVDRLLSDPSVVGELVDNTLVATGTDDRRLAASALSYWATSAIALPALVASAIFGRRLDLQPENLMLRVFERDTVVQAGLRHEGPDTDLELADPVRWLADDVIAGTIVPVVDALRQGASLGRRQLWGNVASSVGRVWGELVAGGQFQRAAALATLLEDIVPLRGLIELRLEPCDGATAPVQLRTTCCLLYRLPSGSYCADCSLVPRDQRVSQHLEVYRARVGAASDPRARDR